MPLHINDLEAAAGRSSWTIRRWYTDGAFGQLGWPERRGFPRGRRRFTQDHVDRVRFIAAASEAGIPLAEIKLLEPKLWSAAGAFSYPAEWTEEALGELQAILEQLQQGRRLSTIARRRRARENAR